MTNVDKRIGARLRIVLAADKAFGPGKADLLEGIRDTGSIASAGRRMNMSYKRAWLLVEALNTMFEFPLVIARRGGKVRGGAQLTPSGEQALACYRRMEALTEKAIRKDTSILMKLLKK